MLGAGERTNSYPTQLQQNLSVLARNKSFCKPRLDCVVLYIYLHLFKILIYKFLFIVLSVFLNC